MFATVRLLAAATAAAAAVVEQLSFALDARLVVDLVIVVTIRLIDSVYCLSVVRT